ncbi:MAG: hypothetical protein ABIL49_07775 [candidate division WOR-3 bacterium]|jgi:succinate dehydrogenase / fumarate reductase membrane anchor subunit
MREGKLWFLHILSGALLVVLLGGHMYYMHLSGTDPLSVENTFKRAKDIFFPISYTLFVALALFHGLYGLRGILLERFHTPFSQKIINILLSFVGFIFFLYALITTWIPYFKTF